MLSLTKHPGINKTDIRYRQVSMLYATLIIVACCFAVLALSNLLYFKHFPIAALDTFGCVSAALVYYYARVTGQFRRASWIIITVLMLVLGGFLIQTQAAAYALMWLTLLPPIAFFLLGLRSGSYVTGFYAVAVLLYIWRGLDEWELGKLTVGAVLNIGEVILIQWFIFRHYEKSRTEAFQLLQDSASTDRLTRLWNRVRLDEFLLDTLAQAGRAELFTAVILLDIDNFKTINDERGHLCGDTVLVSLAKELRACVRQTDRVGRWGGEEFLIICPTTDIDGARVLAEKIRLSVAEAIVRDTQLAVTVSLGLAVARGEVSPNALLQAADEQLYRAKDQGRNSVSVATQYVEPTQRLSLVNSAQ